jgi:pre-mRNA-processing factor 6
MKFRALLDKARQANPGNELWLEAFRVEARSGAGSVQAKATLSRGLQECPTFGLLWSMAVWVEPRASRKTKGVDALRKAKDSALVVYTVSYGVVVVKLIFLLC